MSAVMSHAAAMPATGTPPALEVRGLTSGYGGREVLSALDLALPQGRCSALSAIMARASRRC
ncbi:hypothetical protein ACFQU7_33620 [Pseudoroseomonas wenyumeiae]